MATQPQKNDADAEAKSECLYVKVSMEGAPYLRKVDLNGFSSYRELSSALEKMFSCFTISEFLSTCYHLLTFFVCLDACTLFSCIITNIPVLYSVWDIHVFICYRF
jgi:hypothetical protein